MHVAKLGLGRDGAPTAADRDVRTVAAGLFVRREAVEPLRRGLPPRLLATIDVAGGLRRFPREAGARVKRSVRTDGVRVPAMNLARPHVDAIRCVEAVLPR